MSCYRMASKGIEFRWRWNSGTISTKLELTWEMSVDISYDARVPPDSDTICHETNGYRASISVNECAESTR